MFQAIFGTSLATYRYQICYENTYNLLTICKIYAVCFALESIGEGRDAIILHVNVQYKACRENGHI